MEEKSIQRISIRCSEGQVTWRTPYGGLALDFLPLLKSRRFELCFVARSAFATLQLFLEGNQSLVRLTALDGGSRSSQTPEICLRSTATGGGGDNASTAPVVIFIETDSSGSSPVHGRLVFEYDVRVIPESHGGQTQEQECRPCSDDEVVMAVCTADYAVFGEIHSISRSNATGVTELNVVASRVVRQRHAVVKDTLDGKNGKIQRPFYRHFQPGHHQVTVNNRSGSRKKRRILTDSGFILDHDTQSGGRHLSIVVPDGCHIRRGNGIFLFLGSVRLRRARFGCAPRLEEFKRIWEGAVATGSNPCTL